MVSKVAKSWKSSQCLRWNDCVPQQLSAVHTTGYKTILTIQNGVDNHFYCIDTVMRL